MQVAYKLLCFYFYFSIILFLSWIRSTAPVFARDPLVGCKGTTDGPQRGHFLFSIQVWCDLNQLFISLTYLFILFFYSLFSKRLVTHYSSLTASMFVSPPIFDPECTFAFRIDGGDEGNYHRWGESNKFCVIIWLWFYLYVSFYSSLLKQLVNKQPFAHYCQSSALL